MKWSGCVDRVGIKYYQLPETAKTLVRKIVLEDIRRNGIDKEVEKEIEEFVDFYKQKNYTDDDIVKEVQVCANVYLDISDPKIIYVVVGKVKTPHTYKCTDYKGATIKLLSQEYDKDRNEMGQQILDWTKMIREINKLTRENAELRDKVSALEEELKEREDDC